MFAQCAHVSLSCVNVSILCVYACSCKDNQKDSFGQTGGCVVHGEGNAFSL